MNKSKDKSDLFARPSSERSVISLCLQDSGCFVEARAKLSIEDFLTSSNRTFYVILDMLSNAGIVEFDLASVSSCAQDLGVLNDIGGYEYIDTLFKSNVSKSNLDIYINQVLDASLKYKLEKDLEDKAEVVRGVASDATVSASSILSKVEDSVLSLSLDTLKVEDAKQISVGLRELLKRFEESPAHVRGIRCGFRRLDKLINGFAPGTLSIVAARPKIGKSTLLLNWATHMAMKEEAPVLYIDTEMSTKEVQTRQLSLISGIPERIILNGLYINDKRQTEAVYYALEIMEKLPFIHKYMPGFRIEDVKSMVRKYKAKNDIGAFFFDYIKMVELDDAYNESQLLGVLSTNLKDLAGILDIPVISAVQLNRASHGKSKVSSDGVGDSDKILRYCNLLMSLAKKTIKEINSDGKECGTHRLQILENRSGVSLYSGIDLMANQPVLKIYEAETQSTDSYMEQKEIEEEDRQ